MENLEPRTSNLEHILIAGAAIPAVRCERCPGNALISPPEDLERHLRVRHPAGANDYSPLLSCRLCGAQFPKREGDPRRLCPECAARRIRAGKGGRKLGSGIEPPRPRSLRQRRHVPVKIRARLGMVARRKIKRWKVKLVVMVKQHEQVIEKFYGGTMANAVTNAKGLKNCVRVLDCAPAEGGDGSTFGVRGSR